MESSSREPRGPWRWLLLAALSPLFAASAGAQALTCAAWCDLLSTNCPAEVVHDEAFCLDYCGHPFLDVVPIGSAGDTANNTLACRIHHADQAGSTSGATREAHCAAAALGGGGACGSFCDVYCDLALQVCTSTHNPLLTGTSLFSSGGAPSNSECQAACAVYPESVLAGVSQTDQVFGYGDTVQCRNHHLQAAVVEGLAQSNAYGLHCGHASPVSVSDLCSDIVEPNVINYCVYALKHCVGANALFPAGTAHADCTSFMSGVVASGDYRQDGFASFADTDTNSLGCLNNIIGLAPIDANTWCAKGDWDRANWVPAGPAVCAAPSAAVPLSDDLPWILGGMLVVAAGALLFAAPGRAERTAR
ncbi:MAG: hypothetical protein HRU02_11190 [Myxococcales bacterium]|nr:hypothetical protein [Myxococcales bacterium]